MTASIAGNGGLVPNSLAERFAPGDKVKVVVYGEDSLTGDYLVDGGGSITLPLAGSVRASGLTKAQLERAISSKLRSYLRNPQVTVEGTNFRPFYVLGEVQKPGEYEYRSGLNILSAIAIAGGSTYRASKSKVYIQRSGKSKMETFSLSPDVKVGPGDVVRVPERFF
ncbi:polysaccharide biosynthesis/export family protein [Methyloligella sp. 2.7D]|uniref:polysaccharide biosynthesis/export family protein n=1 Tax=unclassified Methyloligella TaxID=2625955 RepID=UPI00157CE40B|nr:polysaccharide biosynthesis/export family protein [Methyloligella sp. GL2]QKP78187.1 polysaccharide export protein [Methyloligella sp. GL2]